MSWVFENSEITRQFCCLTPTLTLWQCIDAPLGWDLHYHRHRRNAQEIEAFVPEGHGLTYKA